MESNPFGPEKFRQTYAVLRSVAIDLKNIHFSFKDIAVKHKISDTIVHLYADSFLRVPRINLPENIGIDEIHSKMAKYGGSYLCVMADNKNRSLFEVLPNRSQKTLSGYFEQIPEAERKKVKFVTIDFWEPYKNISLKFFPNAHIACDPFHAVKNLSEGFSRIRIDIMNQCVHNSPEYYLLKKWHKLLDSDYYLDNKPKYNNYFHIKMNYRDLYNMLIDINPKLTLAYELKEKYRLFNETCSFEDAPRKLDDLIEEFELADLYCYHDFINLMKDWRQEIINSFERPYNDRKQSNALTESFNQKLRELLAVSHGYANFERFRARAIYCLNNRVFYSLTQSLFSNERTGKPRGNYEKHKSQLKNDPNNDVDTMTADFDDSEE
jgi:transposase